MFAGGCLDARMDIAESRRPQRDFSGKWNKTAYKTDAYHGNPLTGFTATP